MILDQFKNYFYWPTRCEYLLQLDLENMEPMTSYGANDDGARNSAAEICI